MASRSKKKNPNNMQQKQTVALQRESLDLEKEKKSLNSRLSGFIALFLLIALILMLTVPVVSVNITIDLESLATEESEVDASTIVNQKVEMSLTPLEIMIAPTQTEGDVVKYIIKKSGLAKNEQGLKLILAFSSALLTNKEVEGLNSAAVALLVLNYTLLACLIFSIIAALYERNLKAQKYLLSFIGVIAINLICFVEIIFEIIMLISSSSTNASVSVGWGMFVLFMLALSMLSYMIYHNKKYKEIINKEKTVYEKMS